MKIRSIFACAALACVAAAPLSAYYGNTIVVQDQVTKAVGHLWLDANGKYTLTYDLGVQNIVPVPGGVFRIEGRDGTYRVNANGAVCFHPNTPAGKNYGMDRQQELFAGSACADLGEHAVGDEWDAQDSQGRAVKLWLLQGR